MGKLKASVNCQLDNKIQRACKTQDFCAALHKLPRFVNIGATKDAFLEFEEAFDGFPPQKFSTWRRFAIDTGSRSNGSHICVGAVPTSTCVKSFGLVESRLDAAFTMGSDARWQYIYIYI